MNILVTGSNGFIGGHVCEYFINQGDYVIGLDLAESSKKKCNEYVCCNLSTADVDKITEKIKADKIDAVVHLAADMRGEPDTVDVVKNNCIGTQRIIEFCQNNSVTSFVQMSSLPVIGTPKDIPVTEEHSIKPPTVYHVTKYVQELLADYADYTKGLRTVSFRICSPIGIGVNPRTIFPIFVNKALNNEDITLIGKGTRKQTYIHVRDIAQAIYKAVNSEAHGVYNLGSYNLISNYDLAQKCIEVTASKSNIVFIDREDPSDNVSWEISLEKIKNDMGYEPTVSIDEAIKEYADYLKKQGEFDG
ncbi:MAG: NAD(P)-dependent oxidoreductase [Ruminococcus sp.]|nr:NAD(P)-dependent oxidoreductase [Ruminococcus sp.]